jgi:hypothetical protein
MAAVVPAVDEGADGFDELFDAVEGSAADGLAGDDPEEHLDEVEPGSGRRGEVQGYRYIFAGASAGIRNPRGHEVDIGDTPDEALDYLALASLLLRKLDAAGVR